MRLSRKLVSRIVHVNDRKTIGPYFTPGSIELRLPTVCHHVLLAPHRSISVPGLTIHPTSSINIIHGNIQTVPKVIPRVHSRTSDNRRVLVKALSSVSIDHAFF